MPQDSMMISPTKSKDGSVKRVNAKSSISMQRAIDRVSRERNVTKNAPPSTQRKPATAAATTRKSSAPKASNAPKRAGALAKQSKSTTSTSTSSRASSTRPSPIHSKSGTRTVKKSSVLSSSESAKESTLKRRTHTKLASVAETVTVVTPKVVGTNVLHVLKSPHRDQDEKEKAEVHVPVEVEATRMDDNRDESPAKDTMKGFEQGIVDFDSSPNVNTKEGTRTRSPDKIADAEETASPDDDDELEGRDSRDITRKMIADILRTGDDQLSFEFQGYDVPVSYSPAVDYDMALMALGSSPFLQWQNKMSNVVGTKRLEIEHVDIHSVDFVGDAVDMIKMNAVCIMIDDENGAKEEITSGVCYLRDNYVAFLLELFCIDDETSWSILVDNPRVPIGAVSALELPVGKVDEEEERLLGFEIEEIEEAFGLELNMCDLINLSDEAYEHNPIRNEGMCPCPGQSGEQVKIMHLRKEISRDHLLMMRSKFSEKREEGALVSLRVIPLADIWKVSADMKVMCALFLLEKANLSRKDTSDDMSVGVRGLVTSMLRPLTAASSSRCTEM